MEGCGVSARGGGFGEGEGVGVDCEAEFVGEGEEEGGFDGGRRVGALGWGSGCWVCGGGRGGEAEVGGERQGEDWVEADCGSHFWVIDEKDRFVCW